MNNGPLLFLGIFLAIAFSWTGIVLTNIVQQTNAGADKPYYDAENAVLVPAPVPGLAQQGRKVYQEMGCVYCHTQQVRHPLHGAAGTPSPDVARGWGERPNVARDYLNDDRVMLGTMRTGPDLRNIGQRSPDPTWHYRHFYNPRTVVPDSIMPAFAFLFETRPIKGEMSHKALGGLPPEFAPPPGYEVVPTARADALVAYMLSLRTENVSLPELPAGGGQ